jgi:hypothetical protein
MKPAFLVILCLTFSNTFGQFAIIKDREGFVNVRRTAIYENNIVDTLLNDQVIYLWGQVEDWFQIEYEKNNQSLGGYVHKSRIKPISDFDTIRRTHLSRDLVVFQEEPVKITMTKIPFEQKNKKVQYYAGDPSKNITTYPVKINNKKIWGTFGNMPKTQYGKFQIEVSGNNIDLPYGEYDDLYEPNLSYTNAYYVKKTSCLYIVAHNSDGAGAYSVIWIIDKGKYFKRIVLIPF